MNINVYQLPQEETLKPTWKQKLIQEKLPADKNKRVCNLHFEAEYYGRDLQIYLHGHVILANLSRSFIDYLLLITEGGNENCSA